MVSPVRRILGLPWGALAAARARAYRAGLLPSRRVSVPVISVGNLSVGGTGKTPLVVHLVEKLRSWGFRPGVLSRGYGKAQGEEWNDEGRMLERRFPGLPQVQDPDRVAGAERLLREGKADCLVLDDAFQHLRIGRDLDLVCLAADRPWYEDAPLPAGRLREFPSALGRADLIVLTHLEGLDRERAAALAGRASRDSGGKPVLPARHEPSALVPAGPDGSGERQSPDRLAGKRVFLLSAIGSPRSFRATVEGLGALVAGARAFRDHHRFTPAELEQVRREAREGGAELVVTTEKDLARTGGFPFPAAALLVDLVFPEGEEVLDGLLRRVLEGKEGER